MTGISFLGSEIGRGHPFYSDGVIRALEADGASSSIARRASVFDVSRGASLAAWKAVRASYRLAGAGGVVAAAYHRLRGGVDYNRPSLLLSVLGRDLRRWARADGVLVVDHPAVAGALGGRPDVWYVHGELAAPPEAIVHRVARVLVPREEVAGEFVRGGLHPEQVVITGVCIEHDLVAGAHDRAEARRARIAGTGPLTVGFFGSGAEPVRHVETMAAAAGAIAASRHRALVFAAAGGRLARAAASTGAEVVPFRGRAELDRVTAARFAELDAVVSPPHERTNWAIGLGVPFLLVGPDIGPFAPRNRSLMLRSGVAAEIDGPDDARRLAGRLDDLRAKGLLGRMSEMGTGVMIDGFARAARALRAELDRRGG